MQRGCDRPAQVAEGHQGGEQGWETTTLSSPPGTAGAGQVTGGTAHSPEPYTQSCWAGDPSPGHIPQLLQWRAPIWWNPDVTELAWRLPKLDIVNEIAEREGQVRALQSQQRDSHSLSRGTAGSSPLHTVTSSPGKGEGDQRRDPLPSFPRTGELRAVLGGTEPAPAPRFTRTFPALWPHPWAVPAPSHTAFPVERTPGMSGQPPLPPDFLCDSSTPEENQYFSTHQRKDREKHSMGKGTRRMLLACLIPAACPRVPASRLAVGNGTCFPSRSAVTGRHCKRRRAELCSHLSHRDIHAPGAECSFGPPKASEGSVGEDGETTPFPHPTAHPCPKAPSLCRAANKSCSSPLPNS